MEYNLSENISYCRDFVSSVSGLILYSHVVPSFLALISGFYVLSKSRKSLLSGLFFVITLCFSMWSLLDYFVWFSYDKSSILMYAWSLLPMVSATLFAGSLYFMYVFIKKEDLPFGFKVVLFIFIMSFVVLSPLDINLQSYDLQECIAIEGVLYSNYVNYFKLIVSIFIVSMPAYCILRKKTDRSVGEIAIVTLGLFSFVFSFLGSGYVASLTDNFLIEMYGLFAMVIFIGTLFYTIVRFKTFDIKVFLTQILMFIIIAINASQLFYVRSKTNLILTFVNVVVSTIFGLILVRSVKKEIIQREKIEKLAKNLQTANSRLQVLDQQKSEFVSLASHQLRGPLTAIKGYISLILEGDYGKISKDVEGALKKIQSSSNDLAVLVGDYLDVSRIELGHMKYNFTSFSLNDLADEVLKEIGPSFEKNGLELKIQMDKIPSNVHADRSKLKQVMLNLLDNSIKYTPEGTATFILDREKDHAIVTVKDTGVGMNAKVIPDLFQKFSRAPNASKTNIVGTGLGLYVAKKIIDEHGGEIWAESEGEGKGSSFSFKIKIV